MGGFYFLLLLLLDHLLHSEQNQLQTELKRLVGPHQLLQPALEHPPEQSRFRASLMASKDASSRLPEVLPGCPSSQRQCADADNRPARSGEHNSQA